MGSDKITRRESARLLASVAAGAGVVGLSSEPAQARMPVPVGGLAYHSFQLVLNWSGCPQRKDEQVGITNPLNVFATLSDDNLVRISPELFTVGEIVVAAWWSLCDAGGPMDVPLRRVKRLHFVPEGKNLRISSVLLPGSTAGNELPLLFDVHLLTSSSSALAVASRHNQNPITSN